jgi:phosphoribosylglycinamide formyltransferase 1
VSKPVRIAIFASGTGSNAYNLMEYAAKHADKVAVVSLVSDRANIGAMDHARKFGVPVHVCNPKDEAALVHYLTTLQVGWLFLAGYKRIIGTALLDAFFDHNLGHARVLNVHPALLPAFPGLGGYEKAFRAHVKVAGVTVHFVDAGMDTGCVLLQESFVRERTDDLASFEAKGRVLEKKLFVRALELVANGKVKEELYA